MKDKKQYTVSFLSKFISEWTLEANTDEEAKELAKNIRRNGTFCDDELISDELRAIVDEEDNLIEG